MSEPPVSAPRGKAKPIGWVGFTEGHEFWEKTSDGYAENRAYWRLEIFKTRREARVRFQDARPIYATFSAPRGRKADK